MDEHRVQEHPEGQRTSRPADGGQTEEQERGGEEVERVVPTLASQPRVVQVPGEVLEPYQVWQLHVVHSCHALLPETWRRLRGRKVDGSVVCGVSSFARTRRDRARFEIRPLCAYLIVRMREGLRMRTLL